MTQRRDGDVLLPALPADAEWLRLVLAMVDEAVFATDSLGRVRYANAAAQRLCGRGLAELAGVQLEQVLDLVDERTREPLGCTALAGPVGELQTRAAVQRRRDGQERLVQLKATSLPGEPGGDCAMVLALHDLTEQRQAELAKDRLVAIVESSEDAIISKTLEGVITSWNAAAERLFGYTSDEAVGKPITMIIPPEMLDEETYILGRLRQGHRIEHFETVRLTKHGRRKDISLTISPIRDRSGSIVGVSKIARDITEQKRAQVALREADRRKDEFIALLSHELRNPLAPIGNGLQFMKLLPTNTGDVAQVREMMERQLRHLVRLVDDLLDVSRISQNRLQLRRARVALREIVEHAIETANPAIESAGHVLAVSLPSAPVYVDGDLMRLAQVLANLLGNSAKYTDPGGRIALDARLGDREVVISVTDNGVGIPREDLPRVFQMFAQVERSLTRSSGGLGIGLSLVRGIVEAHGGSVSADSDGPGKGSTFTVRLPVAEAPAAKG